MRESAGRRCAGPRRSWRTRRRLRGSSCRRGGRWWTWGRVPSSDALTGVTLSASTLHDFPRLVAGDELLEVSPTELRNRLIVLPVDELAVAVLFHRPEHAKRLGVLGVAHPAQQKRQAGVVGFFVVDEQVFGLP